MLAINRPALKSNCFLFLKYSKSWNPFSLDGYLAQPRYGKERECLILSEEWRGVGKAEGIGGERVGTGIGM